MREHTFRIVGNSEARSSLQLQRGNAPPQTKIWWRRDSNSQTPVSKTGRYSNSRTLALWCTGEDLNLRALKRTAGLQPARLSQTHAPVQGWRKVDESNAHGSSPSPGFRDQLPAIQQYLPRWQRVRESNPLASCESPCLADKCLTVRPTLRQELSKNSGRPGGI